MPQVCSAVGRSRVVLVWVTVESFSMLVRCDLEILLPWIVLGVLRRRGRKKIEWAFQRSYLW